MSEIDPIRSQYPNPKSGTEACTSQDYCVGGAICDYYGLVRPPMDRFPTRYELRERLREINGHLTTQQALAYAIDIIRANDTKDFDEAWTIADRALAFRA